VDNNLKLLDEKIRTELYGALGLTEENLTRIESVEYQGQQSYNLTYAKKNKLYPEFYIIQTDENGNLTDVLHSR
jgi:adenylate cyclase